MIVRLPERRVRVRAVPELCFQVVSTAGDVVEERSPREHVVRFEERVAGQTVVTTELVTLEPPGRIAYGWLDGPLSGVSETIDVVPLADGTTGLRYRGRFEARGAWQVLTALLVRALFDRAVRRHLERARVVSERRQQRSKVFPSPEVA